MSAVLVLVCDVLFGTPAALALGLGSGVVTLLLWLVPPLRRRSG